VQSLRRLIIEVFELAIRFCREAIDYFAAPSFGGIKKAMNSRELMIKTSSQLRPKLAEVRKECEIVMLKELKDARLALEEMQIRLREIQITGQDTNLRVQEDQERWRSESDAKAMETYLSNVRRHLNLNSSNHMPSGACIAKVRAVLKDNFSKARLKEKNGQPLSPALLSSEGTVSS
jgi:hypothetical protein